MDVSMDGLRKRLIADYNSLVVKLNKISKDDECFPSHSIKNELDGIRGCIVTLAFTYMEGEGGWKEMDDNTHFEEFNETE